MPIGLKSNNMTMPDERGRAVVHAYQFLLDLLDPKKTPKVPKEIRRRASSVLRHYPSSLYVELSQARLPEIWGEPKKTR